MASNDDMLKLRIKGILTPKAIEGPTSLGSPSDRGPKPAGPAIPKTGSQRLASASRRKTNRSYA